MNLYWKFKAAYKIGNDFVESIVFGFSPFASKYSMMFYAS